MSIRPVAGATPETTARPMEPFAEFDPEPDGRLPPLDVRIRRAAPSDAPAIAVIDSERKACDPAEIVDQVRASLTKGVAQVWVAETAEAVTAFAKVLHFTPPDDAPSNAAPAGWYLLGIL